MATRLRHLDRLLVAMDAPVLEGAGSVSHEAPRPPLEGGRTCARHPRQRADVEAFGRPGCATTWKGGRDEHIDDLIATCPNGRSSSFEP